MRPFPKTTQMNRAQPARNLSLRSGEEAAGLDPSLEKFGKHEESGSDDGGPCAAALFRNDFENEDFNSFDPRSYAFTHFGAVCP